MTAATLPATVEIPTELLIESVATLLILDEHVHAFTGGQDVPITGMIQEMYGHLLEAATGEKFEDEASYVHPLAVEAYARAGAQGSEDQRRRGGLVREHRNSLWWYGYEGEDEDA